MPVCKTCRRELPEGVNPNALEGELCWNCRVAFKDSAARLEKIERRHIPPIPGIRKVTMTLEEARVIATIIGRCLSQDRYQVELILANLRGKFPQYDWALTPERNLKIGHSELLFMEYDLGDLLLETD